MNFQQPFSEQISQNSSNIANSVSNTMSNAKESLNTTVQDFSSKDYLNSGIEFFETNSLIAKFVFLIMVLILFFTFMYLGIYLIQYFLTPSTSPYVIYGLISGSTFVDIPQDPKNSKSVTIYRSNNEETGMEFTWSTWLTISSVGIDENKYQHIFSKGGNGNFDPDTGFMLVNNAPGVYLEPKINTIRVLMNTVSPDTYQTEYIDIENIPLSKWFNLVIRLQNKILDVYINGVITKRIAFTDVPNQNYDNVFVCGNGGFSGNLSNLQYFPRALSVTQIMKITAGGPNLKTSSSSQLASTNTSYLSRDWYSAQ